VRLRDSGARIAHVPRYLGAFRVHPAQKTSARMQDTGLQEMDRIRARCLGATPSRRDMQLALGRYLWRYFRFNLRRRYQS
jgi:hypothetical protein